MAKRPDYYPNTDPQPGGPEIAYDSVSVPWIPPREKFPTQKFYRVYRAIINQSGTNDPTAQVSLNTTGFDGIWTRDSVGNYILTFNTPNALYPLLNRSTLICNVGVNDPNVLFGMFWGSVNTVWLTTFNASTNAASDGKLYYTAIELLIPKSY